MWTRRNPAGWLGVKKAEQSATIAFPLRIRKLQIARAPLVLNTFERTSACLPTVFLFSYLYTVSVSQAATMSVRSPSRGRSRTRSSGFPHSNSASHRSVSALPDPKPRTRSVSSQSLDNRRNGYRGRSWSRSPSRNREYSRSQSAGRGGRWPRDRTYARSPSPRIRRRSSKVVQYSGLVYRIGFQGSF